MDPPSPRRRNPRRSVASGAAILLLLVSKWGFSAAAVQDDVVGEDEYEVYAAVLGRDTETKVAPPVLLHASTTNTMRPSDDLEAVAAKLYERARAKGTSLERAPGMIASFAERRALETELSLVGFRRPRLLAIPPDELQAIRRHDGRTARRMLLERHSHHTVTNLTRVAFDEKRTQALLGISTWSGPERSESRCVLLERSGDVWTVVASTTLWVE